MKTNDYKRILTIQDISCVGQCSLTVALPILSACGLETAILPSAVLSTHTAGFTGFTVRDLTDDIPGIRRHWEKEKITFDCIYTGYLGSDSQIEYVMDISASLLREGSPLIVDPAMADNGVLYPAFDQGYVDAMKPLCFGADMILPNLTEACLLAGVEYREDYDEKYIEDLLNSLEEQGCHTIVLTGIGYGNGKTGVCTRIDGHTGYYEHEKLEKGCHGTGDVYASAFVGAFMRGNSVSDAARIAADYTLGCIKYTSPDPDHWYGVKFEPLLGELINTLNR